MIDWLFICVPLFWLVFFASAFYLIGAAFNGWIFKVELGQSKFFVCSLLGTCYTVLASLLLLALNLFFMPVVLVMLLTPVIIGLFNQTIYGLANFKNLVLKHFFLLLIILLYFLPESFAVFAPEHLHDAISYHLPYAKEFAQAHGLTINTYLRYPLNTLNFDLLFGLGYLFEGEILARMFNVYSTFLLVVGIYSLCSKHLNKLAGLLAAWAFIDIEMISALMVSGYIDLGLTLFIFGAIFMLLFNDPQKPQQQLYLSAIFFAVALGTKYLALMVLPLYLFWVWLRDKQATWWHVVLILLILGSPWYIRNMWVAGNPIHPFAQQWFGFWLWTTTDLINQQGDLIAHHDIEQTWSELIKLPHLFLNNIFNKHGAVNLMFAAGLALAPVGLAIKGVIRQISAFCLLNTVLWFYSSQVARYLLFVFPFLVIISAYFISVTILAIGKRTQANKWLQSIKLRWLAWPLMFLLLSVCCIKFISYFQKINHFKLIATNAVQWQSMLMQRPAYQLVEITNTYADMATYLLTDDALQLYFDGSAKGDWYGVANMLEFVNTAQQTKDLAKVMKKYRVNALLVEKRNRTFGVVLPLINQAQFELIAENEFGLLYKLRQHSNAHPLK